MLRLQEGKGKCVCVSVCVCVCVCVCLCVCLKSLLPVVDSSEDLLSGVVSLHS